MSIVAFVFFLFAASPAFAGGFGPWTFGMSADQIRSVKAQGPYRAFSNGGLETYNAEFGAKAQNAQFYFKDGHLWRIAIRVYEGVDLTQASQSWAYTYKALVSLYGRIVTPNLAGETLQALADSAKSVVAGGGKAQMAPVSQPNGEFVFSSFNSIAQEGVKTYMVTVNYDEPSP